LVIDVPMGVLVSVGRVVAPGRGLGCFRRRLADRKG
jgi:hypothetical protein